MFCKKFVSTPCIQRLDVICFRHVWACDKPGKLAVGRGKLRWVKRPVGSFLVAGRFGGLLGSP